MSPLVTGHSLQLRKITLRIENVTESAIGQLLEKENCIVLFQVLDKVLSLKVNFFAVTVVRDTFC